MKKVLSEKFRKNIMAFSFIMCLVVVGGLAIYYQYMKRQQLQTASHVPTTETEKLIAKDLEVGYPETPTEVMKLWGRVNQCMYNSSLEEEEFASLLSQLRAMYSNELLTQNPEESHHAKLKAEIDSFKEEKSKIVSYSAETGTGVQYKTINNRECAYIRISYFINDGGEYAKTYQDYILVKENEKWKILGFKASGQQSVDKKEATDKK